MVEGDMQKLLPHQEKFARSYANKAFIVHEGGTGKSICASVWLKDGRDNDAFVVCPKRIVQKWKDTLKEWGTKAQVVSKEVFKKMHPHRYSAIVVDEADEFASPLFTKARSQLSTSLYNLVKQYPGMPVALLTATPIRSNPFNLHTLLCYIGIYIDWKEWRSQFFSLESRPYLRYPTWLPKKDWRENIRPYLKQHADIVLLKDCVDYLPPVTEEVHTLKSEKFKGSQELSPVGKFVDEHRHEQQVKLAEILNISKEYRKVIVVAHYVKQVEDLAKELSGYRETFMVHGGVNKQEEILKKANEVDECFLVIQASLGAGFDADSFSCVIFASMSYKVRDFVQMKFRVRRIHNLHPVAYHYLLAGRCDKQVYKIVQLGRDFVPSLWCEINEYESPQLTTSK